MSKVAHYLQEHLQGEVTTSTDARHYFSTDTSIFSVVPAMVVYPKNESDVRKVARFTWQLAERGRVVPMTARGAGTDQGGAAIGNGMIIVFPAHMNKILQYDAKAGEVTVEPGANYGKLQHVLHDHKRFFPPYPSSIEYATIGGAMANNAGGEKSVKYGVTVDYVQRLRVVLANGEVIETRRLNKKELGKKLGEATFEGEIYRSLDGLLEEYREKIADAVVQVSKNTAGYNLAAVKGNKDGSFDLTPLFIGSQGTLGLITEGTIKTEPYNPKTTLIAAFFDNLQAAAAIAQELAALSDVPSALEFVDQRLLEFVHYHNPNQLREILRPPFPKLVLLIECDNAVERTQKRLVKRVVKLLKEQKTPYKIETETPAQNNLWKIRHSAATIISHADGRARALPIIEDGIVPLAKTEEYIEKIYELFDKYKLQIALWGHAGNGNIHMQPFLDLAQVGDRQKIFKLMEEYYSLVISLGGSTSGEHNDGRLRGAFLTKLYGPEMYELFVKVKQIFDPYGTLNPGVKTGVTIEAIRPLLRQEYSLQHLYQHMPHS